ncbi:MAG TPA: VOC family protein [Chloroflexota bacterium]|nr:VOC family protein [Chloroflexota bacterium]
MPFEARLAPGNNHTAVRVRDLEGLERFYTEVVGLKIMSQRRSTAGVPDATFFTGLQLLRYPEQDVSQKGVLDHVGINVGNLDEIVAHLRQHGVGLVGEIGTPGPNVRTAFFRDPEGNTIELIERTPAG